VRIIAHRGLINGPDKEFENRPESIELAFENDFDAEIDIWRIDGEWFLGHDDAQYPVDSAWIMSAAPRAWFHCKNAEAMLWMANHSKGINFFWHDSDDYTLTSTGYIWAYPGSKVEGNSVIVMPERIMRIEDLKTVECYGVCTDFAMLARKSLQ
jgi:glycerophosphoryl diester phosphodiesterase